MLRPAEISGIKSLEWEWNGRKNTVPTIFHSAWQAPDGRMGIVLVNWTASFRRVTMHDDRLNPKKGKGSLITTIYADRPPMKKILSQQEGSFRINLPPHGCVLIEGFRD
jgi:hypothetical protein